MKTNQIMVRRMGIYDVHQRTKDGMFDASFLSRQFSDKTKTKKHVTDFLRLQSTHDFVEVLYEDIHKTVLGDSLTPQNEGITNLDGIIFKSKVRTLTGGKKEPGSYWFHPYLFIDFAMWLNPRFKLDVVKFVYDQLIEFRHLAGDNYRGLSSAITLFDGVDYSRVARGLNFIIFGKHEPNLRQTATVQQLKSMSALQEKLAFAVTMGYIKSYPELISEMRRIYRIRDQYLAL